MTTAQRHCKLLYFQLKQLPPVGAHLFFEICNWEAIVYSSLCISCTLHFLSWIGSSLHTNLHALQPDAQMLQNILAPVSTNHPQLKEIAEHAGPCSLVSRTSWPFGHSTVSDGDVAGPDGAGRAVSRAQAASERTTASIAKL